MNKLAISSGAIFAMIAVIIGAFGAHKFKDVLQGNLMESYETAVRYQVYHAIALLIVGIMFKMHPSNWLNIATYFFIAGIILFSGSIYLLIYLKSTNDIGLGKLGLLTPIGGLLMILGWISVLIGINQKVVH